MSHYITVDLHENQNKKTNLFFLAGWYGFCWITFHFVVIYFFWLVLGSALLIGIFLWIGNLVALLLDIPLGILQKYFKQKTLLLFGAVMMFISVIIILKFVVFAGWNGYLSDQSSLLVSQPSIFDFLLNGANWALFGIVAILYGVIKESYDVTFLSYIMNNTPPSQYADVISKYNIFFGAGAMLWVVISWTLLTLHIGIATGVLLICIIAFFILIHVLFDNSDIHIDLSQVQHLSLDTIKTQATEKKEVLLARFHKAEFSEITQGIKYVFLRPIKSIEHIDISNILDATIQWFKSFYKVMLSTPRDYIIFITAMTIFLFGFWDTFISTFQVEFLEKIITLNQQSLIIEQSWKLLTWYILLLLLVIPAFALQKFFIAQQKNYTTLNIILIGIVISAVSIMGFGISDNIWLVMWFGIMNSVWYAAAMPLAVATFSERYNSEYAKIYDTQEIDSNSSAAPLRMLLNIANVIGLVIGWALVWIIGFNGFFALFALCLMCVSVYNLIQTGKK